MYVEWAKGADGQWFALDAVDLSTIHATGVYIIWEPSNLPSRPGTVLRVGSGNVALCLAFERAEGLVYLTARPPLVTWAAVEDHHRQGLVRYLIDSLQPVFDSPRQKEVEPIPVNLPLRA